MNHHDAVRLFAKQLRQLDAWMEKAKEHAAAKNFDVNVLATARLSPDAYSFIQQVQAACDQTKYAAAYLSGRTPPSHPDTETNFDELKARIAKALEFAESVSEKDLENGSKQKVSPAWLGGAWLHGDDYLREVAIPNFFFHATMAYAILRHNGVALGKMDYIGSIPIQQG